jgi:adenylyltransferase/sulfurtransferase
MCDRELSLVYVAFRGLPVSDFRAGGAVISPAYPGVPLNILLANPVPHLPSDKSCQVFVLCRLGNDSQIAADAIRAIDCNLIVKDVVGGLRAWSNEIDPTFPVY